METKKLSQFMADYLPIGSTIEVDANWLQGELRELNRLKRVLSSTQHRLEAIECLKELTECERPNYKLDVRG